MKINYSLKNPICYNANNGHILIHSIDMSMEEKAIYGSKYIVEWSDNITKEQIRSNFFVYNLLAGTYKFRLCYNENYSNWTEVILTEPDPMKIISIEQDNNPCDNIASIKVEICGGLPPYRLYYGTFYKESHNSIIEINGLTQYKSEYIRIVDSQNCSIISDEMISTNFNHLFYEIKSIIPPLIYDDHPQEFILTIKNSTGPHKFIIYESDNVNAIKQQKILEINFEDVIYAVSKETKNIEYNLAKYLYPGSYIIDIIDKNNCVYTTDSFSIPNIDPLKVNIKYSDSNIIKENNIIPIDLIFDTILIPYHLLINDMNIAKWIKTLDIESKIVLNIGIKKYEQKIIKYNKEYTYNQDDFFDILQLGSSSEDWYFSIIIGRGFNKDDDIFSDNIYIDIDNQKYLIEPGLDTNPNSLKIIRGNLITSSPDIHQFKNSDIVYIYNDKNKYIYETFYDQTYYTNNIYNPGLMFTINIIDQFNTISGIDIAHPENYKFDYTKVEKANNLKNILYYLNNYNLSQINISAKNQICGNGYCSLYIRGGANTEYDIKYSKYDCETKKIYNIYCNNEIIKTDILYNLDPGIYIIRITDSAENKLKFINNQPYDDHYSAVISLLKESTNTPNINFNYGDILIYIFDSSNIQILSNCNQNLPGIDAINTHIENQIQNKAASESVVIGEYIEYNNEININISQNISYIIVGPNGFNRTFSGNINLKHLYPGVYTITGNTKELELSYLINNTYKIYLGQNNQEYIYIDFPSYKNKLIYKE